MRGKKIIITGGAGSVGSELVRQLCPDNRVFIFDIDETRTYDLYEELRLKGYDVDYRVGDVRDKTTCAEVVAIFKPDVVFHCCAYKHVAPMERYPREAIQTNVNGTRNMILATEGAKFILISTDKVNSSCFMGKTKKMAEGIVKDFNGVVVRFGNVLGSRGSVIPLWQASIDRGEPLNITDERMTRYFMTMEDACNLVIQAGENGKAGETWIMDMGKKVNVLELARRIIKESGKNIGIKMIGIRDGESLTETLMSPEEEKRAVKINNFWVIK